jgi:hypothetical protein
MTPPAEKRHLRWIVGARIFELGIDVLVFAEREPALHTPKAGLGAQLPTNIGGNLPRKPESIHFRTHSEKNLSASAPSLSRWALPTIIALSRLPPTDLVDATDARDLAPLCRPLPLAGVRRAERWRVLRRAGVHLACDALTLSFWIELANHFDSSMVDTAKHPASCERGRQSALRHARMIAPRARDPRRPAYADTEPLFR